MPIYISRGRFTSDAVKGMLAKPENREEAVAKLFESVGGRLIGWYLTFGAPPIPDAARFSASHALDLEVPPFSVAAVPCGAVTCYRIRASA